MSVVTVGNFDGVHLGHKALLRRVVEKAHELGTTSVVLTFDRNTKTVLNGNDVFCLTAREERDALLREEGIDHIHVIPFDASFSAMTVSVFLDYLRTTYGCTDLFGGTDFRFGHGGKGLLLDGGIHRGIRQHTVDLKTDFVKISSSSIRCALQDGLVERANTWLGYPYSVSGIVEEGRHLGRTMGFPTINVTPEKFKILPKDGVYVTSTVIDGKVYSSMTNVGLRPTVGQDTVRNTETHLLSGGGYLYGSFVTVRFHSRLRDEKRFSDLGSLMQQLRNDREEAFLRHRERSLL